MSVSLITVTLNVAVVCPAKMVTLAGSVASVVSPDVSVTVRFATGAGVAVTVAETGATPSVTGFAERLIVRYVSGVAWIGSLWQLRPSVLITSTLSVALKTMSYTGAFGTPVPSLFQTPRLFTKEQ